MTATAKAIDAWAQGAIDRMTPDAKPRFLGDDHSIASGMAAEYSPATKIPPRNRSSRMSPIVHAPMSWWVGMTAMSPAQAAVPAMARRVVRVRPSRSEMRPKIIPPRGRPSSMAMTTKAPMEALAEGPASTAIAGARAVRGRKT